MATGSPSASPSLAFLGHSFHSGVSPDHSPRLPVEDRVGNANAHRGQTNTRGHEGECQGLASPPTLPKPYVEVLTAST